MAAGRRRIRFPAPLGATRSGDTWTVRAGDVDVRLSHLDKVYWPDDGITKGDLLTYYRNVAPLLLPHLADRPLTLHRMPEGLAGKPFYEKQVPAHAPGWVHTAPVPVDEESKVVDFVLAQDLASLLWVVNLGCIELHPLHSRAGSLEQPDYCFFDLDPFPPYSYADVCQVAKLVRVVLDQLGLRGYPKTSGATGMQVFVPLTPGHSYEQARGFVERVGRMIVAADPERATMRWMVSQRAGKVFIDHNMNRRGANIVSAYSVRPEPGAPVSMPLDWAELDGDLDPHDFRIDNVWDRLAAGPERFAPVLADRQALQPALEALGVSAADPGDPPAGRRSSRRWGGDQPAGALADYERKRDFSRTPEPSGRGPAQARRRSARPAADGAGPANEPSAGPAEDPDATQGDQPYPAGLRRRADLIPGRRFVIQQHHARRLHHDVRFERDGVLVSFAVPKRLPEAHGVRHLAVHTEDHPLSYLTFSGTIPAKQYGAGEVRLFDLGSYEPLEVTADKLSVRLHGSRYPGTEYHFVHTKDNDWLCLLASRSDPPPGLDAPRLDPMLAVATSEAFDDDAWQFEVKWDGHRSLAQLCGTTRLRSRTGRDVTGQFPELGSVHQQLAARGVVLDGEVVALDPGGVPALNRLQDRFHRSPAELARRAGEIPVQLIAFDLLWIDGESLLDHPLTERQTRLSEVLVENDVLRLSRPVRGRGLEYFRQARELGLEGVVGKRRDSPYRPGRRSADWRKIKAVRRQDCVIVGWLPGQGGRSSTIGSLALAVRDDGEWSYAGNCGTGFTEATLDELRSELLARQTDAPAVARDPALRAATWVRPELVCEVEYLSWTPQGRLRAASFRGLRDDMPPEACVRESPAPAPARSRRAGQPARSGAE